MAKIVISGAGRLGTRVANVLAGEGRGDVHLIDAAEDALFSSSAAVSKTVIDGSSGLANFLAEGDTLVNAGRPEQGTAMASLALQKRCHYLDFDESQTNVEAIRALQPNGVSTLLPACGFSPGLQSALIADFADGVTGAFDLDVYVGIIPTTKANRLGFGMVMNIDGLLQEYRSKAKIKRDGNWIEVEPLTELEDIVILGQKLEAFVTGGSTNELPNKVADRIRNYAYRTLRYPGHLDYIRFLIDDLQLGSRSYMLSNLLMNGLPTVATDQAIIHLVARLVTGRYGEETRQRTWRVAGRSEDGGILYDIAARHSAAILGLLETGDLAGRGPIRQDDVDASMILATPQLRGLFDVAKPDVAPNL